MSCRHVYLEVPLHHVYIGDNKTTTTVLAHDTSANRDSSKIASQPKVGKDFNSCKKEPRRLHSNNVLRPPMSGRGGLQFPRNQDTTDDSLDAALSRDRGETRQGS
jgi:hypothetical protein